MRVKVNATTWGVQDVGRTGECVHALSQGREHIRRGANMLTAPQRPCARRGSAGRCRHPWLRRTLGAVYATGCARTRHHFRSGRAGPVPRRPGSGPPRCGQGTSGPGGCRDEKRESRCLAPFCLAGPVPFAPPALAPPSRGRRPGNRPRKSKKEKEKRPRGAPPAPRPAGGEKGTPRRGAARGAVRARKAGVNLTTFTGSPFAV